MNSFKVHPQFVVMAILVATLYHFFLSIPLGNDTLPTWFVEVIYNNLKLPMWVMLVSSGILLPNVNLRTVGACIGIAISIVFFANIGYILGGKLAIPLGMFFGLLPGAVFGAALENERWEKKWKR